MLCQRILFAQHILWSTLTRFLFLISPVLQTCVGHIVQIASLKDIDGNPLLVANTHLFFQNKAPHMYVENTVGVFVTGVIDERKYHSTHRLFNVIVAITTTDVRYNVSR